MTKKTQPRRDAEYIATQEELLVIDAAVAAIDAGEAASEAEIRAALAKLRLGESIVGHHPRKRGIQPRKMG
jgi:hypothetical protein